MRAAAVTCCLGLAGVAVAGCSDPAGLMQVMEEPGVLQVVDYQGTILFGADPSVDWSVPVVAGVLVPPSVVTAPDTVQAGQAFHIVVTTIGINGCWAAGGLRAREVEGGVDLRPTDVHSGSAFCTEMAHYLERDAHISLDVPGEYMLRVRGRRLHHGKQAWEEPVTAQIRIVVQ